MSKQWARQEAKENWVAQGLEGVVLWVKMHQQASVWGGLGLVAAIFVGVAFYQKVVTEAESSWSQYAIAQSYAYSGQPQPALQQVQRLNEEYPSSTAASYGLLLAGDILFEQNQYAQAAAMYQKVADQPNHVEALPLGLANLALSKEAVGDFQGSVTSGQQFLDAYGDHFLAPQVHASVARSFAALGQSEQAQATYQRIVFLYSGTYWEGWAKERMKS